MNSKTQALEQLADQISNSYFNEEKYAIRAARSDSLSCFSIVSSSSRPVSRRLTCACSLSRSSAGVGDSRRAGLV